MSRNTDDNFTSEAIFVTDNGGYSLDRPYTDVNIPAARDSCMYNDKNLKKEKKKNLMKMSKNFEKQMDFNSQFSTDSMTKAAFYGECASNGISFGDAHAAIEETQSCYRKWWLQQVQGPLSASSVTSSSGIGHHARKVLIFSSQVLQLFEENNPNKKRKLVSSSSLNHQGQKQHSGSYNHAHECKTQNRIDYNIKISDDIEWKVGIEEAKMDLLKALSDADNDTTGSKFVSALTHLQSYRHGIFARNQTSTYSVENKNTDNLWFNMSRPLYTECLGKNSRAEYLYKLGRLSFDMFPLSSKLVCSIQGMFNYIGKVSSSFKELDVSVPTSLKQELRSSTAQLRFFNIIISLTIESPNQDEDGIKATLTNYGYILPNSNSMHHNRWTTWFDRGTLEPSNLEDLPRWRRLFQNNRSSYIERGRQLAYKILLGATIPQEIDERDGSLTYFLARPIGGHNIAYIDILFEDDTLCITRGHYGNVYVMGKQSESGESNKENDDEKKDDSR